MHDYIVASIGEWNEGVFKSQSKKLKGNWYYVNSPEELNNLISVISPRYIFFPHWRWIVPKQILEEIECVCFHMTDVPYGRGGSPLQNLILRGHKETVLTALRMEETLDTGPVYYKKPLCLFGTAGEIYKRAEKLSWKIIEEIVKLEPKPTPQTSESVVQFHRRKPEESEVSRDMDLEALYDFIRMLDAPGYPHAFIKYGKFTIEFKNASLNKTELSATVKIISQD